MTPQDLTYEQRAAFHRRMADANAAEAREADSFDRTAYLDQAKQHAREAERFETYIRQEREAAKYAEVPRIRLSGFNGSEMRTYLDEIKGSAEAERIFDQVWLHFVFVEQRKRTVKVERDRFTERADAVLALLDWKEEPCLIPGSTP